ncbi:MAG: BatA domain-containing protein [Xanthomonadaceae bacterium]|nr:BatA domain-containing protein [Xanthomonadaceae bacterium]
MTPGLLLPVGLLALAGVLVPLLIHLVRRSEMLVSDFAALRWLAAKARPRRRLRFDERLLLAVRLLLIASIAALLAQPTLTGWPAGRDWLLVAPGVAVADLPTPDPEREGERRWLAPGLPPLSAPTPAVGPTSSLSAPTRCRCGWRLRPSVRRNCAICAPPPPRLRPPASMPEPMPLPTARDWRYPGKLRCPLPWIPSIGPRLAPRG